MQENSDMEMGNNLIITKTHPKEYDNDYGIDDTFKNSKNYEDSSSLALSSRKHRSRRFDASPTTLSTMLESYAEPSSPVSSTDQGSSADATFEPTIEMMVNDFDDEQTLNEEEALAEIEAEDPIDEIETLQKESEMPIEELLAMYQSSLPLKTKQGKRRKTSKGKRNKKGHKVENITEDISIEDEKADTVSDVIVIDSGDEQLTKEIEEPGIGDDEDDDDDDYETETKSDVETVGEDKTEAQFVQGKHKRSQLMNLYPENYGNDYKSKDIPLESIYGGEDEEFEEDDEPDADYVRKTIMVGSAYQAVIPIGLSKYGDVLPYENEDKLIWEPSQVSEKEVEDYLIQTRDIKNMLSEKDQVEEYSTIDDEQEGQNASSNAISKNYDFQQNEEKKNDMKIPDCEKRANTKVITENEALKVVKDNEQALHLLVQCGYDFKEALRRERLNAVPLTGSMSIWSEEECRKFEEGIQKFGKDFLKIRQQQVRTRSMRELVQFYYLWKKSERRDHDFADSDTVDHMDMYLNEGDYNSNPVSTSNNLNASSAITSNLQGVNNKKGSLCTPKNFSIMTGTCMVVSGSSSNATTNMCIAGISNHAYSSKSGQARRHGSGTESNCQLIADKN